MDLFSGLLTPLIQVINIDGDVQYYGEVFDHYSADQYFQQLLTDINWQHDQAIISGDLMTTKRKIAWHGDHPYQYTYSNVTKIALPWQPILLKIKAEVEKITHEHFNACLLNLYHNGSEGMAWHSDGEKDLKKNGAIASVSFGEQRKFAFKHKFTQEVKSLELPHGSLLVMKGCTQNNWLHRLPPVTGINKARINLTFRMIEDRNLK